MGTPTLYALSIAGVGIVLVVFGVIYKARSDDKTTYQIRAQTAGIDPGRFEEAYRLYRHNRAFVGNIAIWIGGGFVIATIFNLV
jgi:hypothetical protein